jgi:predicted MFS family arabinose efflux permease
MQSRPRSASSALRKARWATRSQFAVLGLMAGVWGAHIPSVKAQHGLDEAQLSLVLLTAGFGAILSLLLAGRVVAALGARRCAMLAGVVLCAALAMTLQVHGLTSLLPVALAMGMAMSLFDVAINTEGSELEHLGGQPVMSNLHAMFSIGGMLGAAAAAGLLKASVPPPNQLVAMGAGAAAVVLLGTPGMLNSHAPADAEDRAHFVWPRGLLLLLGLLVLAGMVAEGVMYDWCVLYLKQELGLPQEQAAIGYAVFAGAMALTRLAGDSLRQRYSERSLLRAGAGLAAAAMAVVLLAAVPGLAFVGFALAGAGLAPVAPILFNAATRVPGASRAAGIAAVTSIGYSGFMLGPPLVGGLAHAWSLTAALGVVVFSAAVLAWCARYVPEANQGCK